MAGITLETAQKHLDVWLENIQRKGGRNRIKRGVIRDL